MKFSPSRLFRDRVSINTRDVSFSIWNSYPDMKIIELFSRHDSLSFPLFGRRKNRSISLDSRQLTAVNGTLINRQRGFTMANVFMARLFRFKPLGYVSWPRGRTGAR